jgi:hypothetical protein
MGGGGCSKRLEALAMMKSTQCLLQLEYSLFRIPSLVKNPASGTIAVIGRELLGENG